jgi:hypothetical protein
VTTSAHYRRSEYYCQEACLPLYLQMALSRPSRQFGHSVDDRLRLLDDVLDEICTSWYVVDQPRSHTASCVEDMHQREQLIGLFLRPTPDASVNVSVLIHFLASSTGNEMLNIRELGASGSPFDSYDLFGHGILVHSSCVCKSRLSKTK